MTKTSKRILLFVLIAAVVVISYLYYKKAIGEPVTNPLLPKSAPANDKNRTDAFPLKKGSTGERVKALQEFLNYSGSYGLTVDGIFGSKTEQAVILELSPAGGITKEVSQDYYYKFIVPFINYATTGYTSGGYTVTGTDSTGHTNGY